MSDARLRGNQAEVLAANALLARGYTIVTRRFKSRRGEIDLVARDGETWVFIEVKASERGHETALTHLTSDKRQRLSQAADEFFERFDLPPAACRFDVVTVQGEDVRHIEDAFGDWTD
ncbi:MAG: YraN family protein [Chthonomonas sp.]|nr:YraN family protein [Chthonomonas sp.]